MFYLTGFQECLSTMLLLSSSVSKTPIRRIDKLNEQYIIFLNTVCSDGSIPNNPNHSDQYCFDTERINLLVSHYEDSSGLTDLKADIDLDTPLSAMQEALHCVKQGKLFLESVNPSLAELFDLTIHTLFYARSSHSGGGSVSDTPGVIWCSIKRNWTDMDIAEFLLHELTHNLFFLDELCYDHYIDIPSIMQRENYARSSILGIDRPLDKAFHSLLVTHELLCYRQETGEPEHLHAHPSSSKIFPACRETIRSIDRVTSKKDLVTPRFFHILEKIEESLNELESNVLLSVVA